MNRQIAHKRRSLKKSAKRVSKRRASKRRALSRHSKCNKRLSRKSCKRKSKGKKKCSWVKRMTKSYCRKMSGGENETHSSDLNDTTKTLLEMAKELKEDEVKAAYVFITLNYLSINKDNLSHGNQLNIIFTIYNILAGHQINEAKLLKFFIKMIYYIEGPIKGTGSNNKIYIDSNNLNNEIIHDGPLNLLKLLSELVHGDASSLAKAISNIIKDPNQF